MKKPKDPVKEALFDSYERFIKLTKKFVDSLPREVVKK